MQTSPEIPAKTPGRYRDLWMLSLIVVLVVAAIGVKVIPSHLANMPGARTSRLQHDLYATSVARRQVGDDSYASVYRVITRMDLQGDTMNVHTTLAPLATRQAVLVQIALLNVSVDEKNGLHKFVIYDDSGAVLEQA